MEEIKTETVTAPAATPRNSKLATWSLVMGIIGTILCVFIIPSLLAIIFGIVALVQIGKSAGALKGKGKAIAGIILGGVAFVLIPVAAIVAAIAIPGLLSSHVATQEISAVSGLKSICNAESIWRMQDSDGNGERDYWTYDISCLYRMKGNNALPATLIDISIAWADYAPAGDEAFGADFIEASRLKGKGQIPHYGYLFQAMESDENGEAYNQNEVGVNKIKAANSYKFAFVAYPKQYGHSGKRTFIINEEGTVYSIDSGSDQAKIVLQWPSQSPLGQPGPGGRTWQPAE